LGPWHCPVVGVRRGRDGLIVCTRREAWLTSNRDSAATIAAESTADGRRAQWRAALISIAVTAFFLGVLYVRVDIDAFADSMTDIKYGLLLPVLGMQAVSWWLRTVRWRFLLSPFQPIPTTRLFSIVMTGALINNLVPGRAGEFWRAHTVGRREGLSRATTFGTIVVERVIDGVVLVVLAAVMVLAIGPTTSLAILTASMLVVFGIALGGIAALALSHRLGRNFTTTLLALVPSRYKGSVEDKLELFVESLRGMQQGRVLRVVVAVTALIWVVEACAYWTLGEAFGLDVAPQFYLLVVAIGNLGVAVPFSVGAIGPFEFFVQQTLIILDVSSGRGLAYAVCIHGLSLAFVVGSGLLFVGWRGLRAGPGSRPPAPADSPRSGVALEHKSVTRPAQGDDSSKAPRNKFRISLRPMGDD
jgi:uncharacterized protein (TIRG00374 family)